MTRAAWKMHGSKAERCRCGFDLALSFCRGQRRGIVNDLTDRDLGPCFPRDLRCPLADRGAQARQRACRQVAKLDRVPHESRYDVRGIRCDRELADGSHLPARSPRDLLLHRLDELRRGEQRVVALGHRRGPGVVGHAANLDCVFIDADDAVDNTDRDSGLLEGATLLDVQLEVRVDRARRQTGGSKLRGISANPR